MPRRKTMSDEEVLEAAVELMFAGGPDVLTFASLAQASGLSGATLVQRFGSKAGLRRRALLHAWDKLEARTARLSAEAPRTPRGAVALLAALSAEYGTIERFAEGLLFLREDLRDPVLRARGAAWKAMLVDALDACFPDWPATRPPVGSLLAAQWQGALIWWGFDPAEDVSRFVENSLESFLGALAVPAPDRR